MKNTALYRYGYQVNTHDLLKAVAILLMIIDHIGHYLRPECMECRLIGRGAAPLFFFLIGYTGKLRITNQLIIYGLILSGMGFFFYGHLWINILINFILIYVIENLYPITGRFAKERILLFSLALVINPFINPYLEYGTFGLMFAYCGSLVKAKYSESTIWLTFVLVFYYIGQSFYFKFYQQDILLTLFGLLCLSLFFLMRYYQFQTLRIWQWARLPILILSRYSLIIYFYHLILIQMIFICKTTFCA